MLPRIVSSISYLLRFAECVEIAEISDKMTAFPARAVPAIMHQHRLLKLTQHGAEPNRRRRCLIL